MKTSFRLGVVVLLALCGTVVAGPVTNRNDDAVIIAAAVPGVREIQPTAYGYRVMTTNATVSVYSTPSGVRSQSFEASRTAYGYRVSVRGVQTRSYYASPMGYNAQDGSQIHRTMTGYDLGSGTLTSNVMGYTYRRK